MSELSEIQRHEGVRVPVGDETGAATRYEPLGVDGPAPALLMYVPYHQQDSITYGGYDPLNRYLAANGYEVLVADMIGTGASTGFIEKPFTRREGREPAAIVEWLAAQPWTTGRVGMFGKSYGGITSLDAAAQRPDGLEAIVPIHTPFEGVRNAYTYGGLFEFLTIGMDWLTLMQALDAKPPSNPTAGRDALESWRERLDRLDDRNPWLFQFLEHGPEDDYWDDKDIPVSDIDVPVLAVDGWRDPYIKDTLRYVDRIDAPTRVLFGPWRHRMPHRGRECAIDFRRQVTNWFDHWLKEGDETVLDLPPFRVWTELDGGGTTAGCWREFDQWPTYGDAETQSVSFVLNQSGLVESGNEDGDPLTVTVTADPTVGTASVDPYGAAIAPPLTNDDDARTVTFDSAPLKDPVELTGTGALSLRIEPETANPTVVARVVDIDPDGQGTMVTRGAVRGASRNTMRSYESMTPGEEYELDVPLSPKSHVFEAGHVVRVAIGSALFPELQSTPEAGDFRLRSSPTRPSKLDLPGRQLDSLTFDDAISIPQPDDRISPNADRSTGSTTWETTREHVTGETKAVKTSDRTVELPQGTLSQEGVYEASVDPDDPASASARNELTITVENDLGTFEVVATNYLSETFCRAVTTVSHNGDRVYQGRWTM